jgi:hypothetical protein
MKKLIIILTVFLSLNYIVKAQVVVVNDTFTVLENTTFTGNVTLNDTFQQLDSVILLGSPLFGNAFIDSATGSFTYTPINGFSGTDSVDYVLFEDAQSFGEARIYINVISANVWPGDANYDGVANNIDLLYIGIAYGTQGEERNNPTLQWTEQESFTWPETFNNTASYKHADCNGDGTVNEFDIEAISLNYNQTHQKALDQECNGGVPLYIQWDNTRYEVGDTARGELILGTQVQPMLDIYGIAFTINYNNEVVKENTLQINFDNSWITTPDSSINMVEDFWALGRVDASFSKTNQANSSGNGPIGSVIVIIDDNIQGIEIGNLIEKEALFSFSNILALQFDETEIEVCGEESSIIGFEIISSINNAAEHNFKIYPNPSKSIINIENNESEIKQLVIYNVQGQIVWQKLQHNKNNISIDASFLNEGVYFVEITNQNFEKFQSKLKIVR